MQSGQATGAEAARRARWRELAALGLGALLAIPLFAVPDGAAAQITPGQRQEIVAEDDRVQLDFNDVELSVVIDTIARLTVVKPFTWSTDSKTA